jgi:hypothetical protein
MIALAAALLLAPVQDESKLKDAWPKLVDAWKAVEAYQAAPSAEGSDDFLKTAGRIHEAFEAAGLYGSEGEYVPQALKTFVKARVRGWFRNFASGNPKGLESATLYLSHPSDPMKTFLESIARLQVLQKRGLDDEDNVQDELSSARRALKAMRVTADETPGSLRRRVLALAKALALGEPYPEPALATEEQAKSIRDQIGKLGSESIEERDQAVRELARCGDAALPFLRESLKSPDAETAARSRHLLGFGHAPWTAAPVAAAGDGKARLVEDLKIREVREALKRNLDEDLERAKKR